MTRPSSSVDATSPSEPPSDVDQLAEDIAAARDAAAGHRASFARLYDSYAPMVHAIVLARAPAGETDDLVQEVFAVAWQRISSLRDAGAFGPWVAAIARRRAVDAHRRRRQTEPLGEPAARTTTLAIAEARGILAIIRTLPEAYREPLVMRFVEGMTGPEIAMRTGLTAGSVRVNLHRGVKLLRAKLSGDHGDQR